MAQTFQQRVRVSYFGYTAEFTTSEGDNAAIRAEANAIILAKFGPAPAQGYVEPGLPFPAFVPVHRWDEEDGAFY